MKVLNDIAVSLFLASGIIGAVLVLRALWRFSEILYALIVDAFRAESTTLCDHGYYFERANCRYVLCPGPATCPRARPGAPAPCSAAPPPKALPPLALPKALPPPDESQRPGERG